MSTSTLPAAVGRRRRPLLARLGPFAYLGTLLLGALLVLSTSRLFLVLAFHERVALEPQYLRLFPLALRLDLSTAGTALVLPALGLLLLPGALVQRLRPAFAGYFALVLTLLALMEAVTYDFVAQYDVRPNRLFIEYLGSLEVLETLWMQYRAHLALVVLAGAACTFAAWRLGSFQLRAAGEWHLVKRGLALLLLAPALLLGIRGTLRHRPINAAMLAFSSKNLVNQLALNSTYTVLRAWYEQRHERSPVALYGRMPDEEVLARVGKYARFPVEDGIAGGIPFLHRQRPRVPRSRPLNLVLVLEESLGAEFVGCLGGKPLTPCFDELAKEGLLLTRLFCTGTRTVRGIEATACGFLPTPGSSVVKLARSQSDFFTIAALLRQHGYATDFVYGGESHFDNMAAFFLANGFERALDEDDYEDPAFRGTWGVSDEDLMRAANEVFRAHGDRPFFALILSTSNHSPFEFPDGRIQLYDAEKCTRNNTVKYADHALGELFRLARQEAYWKDTLWVVVADHDERTYGDELIPLDKFHVPGLLIGPGVAPGRFERIASQIDLMPTALDLLGLVSEHPMIGRNLLALPADDPGRAVVQFNDVHGLLVGDRLAVHPGSGAPRCFRLDGWHLLPDADDPGFVRDALAHALLPWILYEGRLYRAALPGATLTTRVACQPERAHTSPPESAPLRRNDRDRRVTGALER